MAVDRETYRKVARARADLVLDHPFFGHLALQMKLVEDRECDTAWSDGRTLAYNPLYAGMLPGETLKGLMGHVVMHPACRHHLRRNGRQPRLWNMACDYAINWILLEAGLVLPDGYLDDPGLRGKTADEIYVCLLEKRDGHRSEAPDRPSESRKSAEGEPTEVPDSPPNARRRTAPSDAEQDGGSEADGQSAAADTADKNQREPGRADPGLAGEVRDAPASDAPNPGTGDAADDESQWKINLAQAFSRARSMGDLPAGLARLVENLLSPKLDWRSLLNRFIRATARYDYAWMPPNRRYLHRGLYLPAMRSDDLPEVVVAVDTSGSVSARELDQFAAELSSILEACATTVHILYCDTQVARAQTVSRQDLPFTLTPIGGGGTDFRPAFQWVAQQGLSPLCLIYLTDLACVRFPEEPSYPVLWAFLAGADTRPPFGESVALR